MNNFIQSSERVEKAHREDLMVQDNNHSEKSIQHNSLISSTIESSSVKCEKINSPGLNRCVLTESQCIIVRMFILSLLIVTLVYAKSNNPSNDVECLVDKVQLFLEPVTRFLMTPGNEIWRETLQSICSGLMDVIFFITLGYWVYKGNSSRLIVTLAIFYIVRGLLQLVFLMPFPELYFWERPSLPSLVVSYGKESDFFYSGHSGFLVICMNEWEKIGNKTIRNGIALTTIYTVWILIVYRIHYCIDIFTGLFFADWVFGKVDKHREFFDAGFAKVGLIIKTTLDFKLLNLKDFLL